MKIKKIELFHIKLPLNFTFITSKTVLKYRESIVVKATNECGSSGFGEVVSFNEPFYTKETLSASKSVLIKSYIPLLFENEITHPFDLHKYISLSFPMAVAGLENALLDLYTRHNNLPIMSVFNNEIINTKIRPGIVLGDSDTKTQITQIHEYLKEGYTRFKFKIKPNDGFEKIYSLRQTFPELELLVDANRSFELTDTDKLYQLDKLNLRCIEEPLNSNDLQEYQKLQKRMKTPLCLDESIQTIQELENAISLNAFKILNVKIGRVGGFYYAMKMIELCRKYGIGYWIGSMLESGISKILHIHLASLNDTYIPGDLSASSRYFKKDLINPEIVVDDGMISVPNDSGLGVTIDEEFLEKITFDYIAFS